MQVSTLDSTMHEYRTNIPMVAANMVENNAHTVVVDASIDTRFYHA